MVYYCNGAAPCTSGYMSALTDQARAVAWGCDGASVGASGENIGDGATNTAKILTIGCLSPLPAAALAASNYKGGGLNG